MLCRSRLNCDTFTVSTLVKLNGLLSRKKVNFATVVHNLLTFSDNTIVNTGLLALGFVH